MLTKEEAHWNSFRHAVGSLQQTLIESVHPPIHYLTMLELVVEIADVVIIQMVVVLLEYMNKIERKSIMPKQVYQTHNLQ